MVDSLFVPQKENRLLNKEPVRLIFSVAVARNNAGMNFYCFFFKRSLISANNSS